VWGTNQTAEIEVVLMKTGRIAQDDSLPRASVVNCPAMIRFSCASCKEKLVVPDRHAGRRGKCPNCGSINRVPTGSEFDAPPAMAPAPGKAATVPPRTRQVEPIDDGMIHMEATAAPRARPAPGLVERLLDKMSRKPAPGSDLDVYDTGGIQRAVKIMFVVGILVLLPLGIGAAFVVMILLRVKLGN
jgi:predicted RNA-binding Zn-ribbon protein involved in translation (DUF1610 family)